jgi:hypothetical protein
MADAWSDEEGFHVTIEFWSDAGHKLTSGPWTVATRQGARDLVDHETAKLGFAPGECPLDVERMRAGGT